MLKETGQSSNKGNQSTNTPCSARKSVNTKMIQENENQEQKNILLSSKNLL